MGYVVHRTAITKPPMGTLGIVVDADFTQLGKLGVGRR